MPPTFSFSGDNYIYDNRFAGVGPYKTLKATILAGAAVIQPGTLLGKITATGKLRPYLASSTDGSQVPYVILADAADVTTGDVVGLAYFEGQFNASWLIGYTAANFDQLRNVGLLIKQNVTVAGVI